MLLDHGAVIEGDEIGAAAKKWQWNVVRVSQVHTALQLRGRTASIVRHF
jgi:hypothetical protein